MAKARQRHPGRRSPASTKVQNEQKKLIKAAVKLRDQLAKDHQKAITDLAKQVDEAMAAGVQTQEIGTWFASKDRPNGMSRQAVYKLVRERVDGKPISNGKASTGNKSASKTKAKSSGSKKATTKPKATKAKAGSKAKPAAKAKSTKATAKSSSKSTAKKSGSSTKGKSNGKASKGSSRKRRNPLAA